MTTRPGVSRLARRLIALLAFMLLILVAFGYGMGVVEVSMWFGGLIVGTFVIVRAHIHAVNGKPAQ